MGRLRAKPRKAGAPRAAGDRRDGPAAPRLVRYEITRAPLVHPALDALPQAVRDHYEGLRAVAPRTPRLAVGPLEALIEQYPQVPQFSNLLTVAYSAARDRAGTEASIRAAYERHPDDLFARLNYAELCLSRGEAAEVPGIFGGHLDLRAVYPGRKVFHVAEVVPFCGVMAEFLLRQGRREEAEEHYRAMWALDPKNRLTRRVGRLLRPPLLQRLLARLR